mgnify:FL=1
MENIAYVTFALSSILMSNGSTTFDWKDFKSTFRFVCKEDVRTKAKLMVMKEWYI